MKILNNRFKDKKNPVFCDLATNNQTTSLHEHFDEYLIYGYYVSPQILFNIINNRDNININISFNN